MESQHFYILAKEMIRLNENGCCLVQISFDLSSLNLGVRGGISLVYVGIYISSLVAPQLHVHEIPKICKEIPFLYIFLSFMSITAELLDGL